MAVFWRRSAHGSARRRARRDRSRLQALLEATLELNGSMGVRATKSAIVGVAGELLRSPEATLTTDCPGGDVLAAPLRSGAETLWLSVPAGGRDEPYDDEDQALLEALASVASVALANADLYGEVARQKDALSAITSSMGEGVCAINEEGRITFMNPSGADMLGWYSLAAERDVPQGHAALPVSSETPDFLLEPAKRAMTLRRNVTTYDTRFTRIDGSHFPVTMTASPVLTGDAAAGAGAPGAVIVFRDISERTAFEEQLARHAFQDSLTGLANRRLLLDHLDHALLQADRTRNRVAVLFCDIDRFKAVNDELGHQVGDELLRVIGERLRRTVRAGDTLSRFGGDEFVILLEGVASPDDAGEVAKSVLDVLRDPITLSTGHEVVATLSIGVAVSEPGKTREDLLHDADQAMYRAKEQGRGGHVAMFGADKAAARSLNRLSRDTAFQHVVDRGEMEIHYQPLVSLADRRIVGAEALVRWNDPDHGILLPGQFIRLAERNGTIVELEQTVLEQACRQAKTWQREFGPTLQIGVNVSALHVQERNLAEHVAAVLSSTGLDPAQLCLDISESVAMQDIVLTTSVLGELHALGVHMAIDDFGTGHSSFGHLARFPFDVVKIDQSYVHGVDSDPVKSAIVSAVIALARTIGAATVAEGVESAAQLETLIGLGCSVAQGYYFARPLPTADFGKMLTASAASDLRLLGTPAPTASA
ncbi:MAG TPA: EAL domain-containing protein [Acidimicrobiales bacterium]|nr:EAL domain-containing protein [Acidimicrobiales bacterium]